MIRGAKYFSLSQACPSNPQLPPQLFRTSSILACARLPVATATTACRRAWFAGSSELMTPSGPGSKKAVEIVRMRIMGWFTSIASQTRENEGLSRLDERR